MPTWTELQSYARSKYKLAEDDERSFRIIFGFEDGRSQIIDVQTFDAFNQQFIEFRSPVCKEDQMNPRTALLKNTKLPIGSLALTENGYYVLVHNASLKHLDLEEFELPLHVMAKIADSLENEFSAKDDL